MSVLTSPEFRLLYAVALSALALLGSWKLARRWEPDRLRAVVDALLLFYLAQYLSVCIPGLIGALHPITMGLVAILLSAVMLAAGMRKATTFAENPPIGIGGLGRAAMGASSLFLLGYLSALIWHQRQVPVVSNDAITYHLPAAVQWLQTGRLGLYEAWFYNPANSYSPLGGSTFIVWLIAPTGNDILGRFVEVGPLLFLFLAMVNLLRALGLSVAVASVYALAAVMVRTYISQTILAKDDLFVAVLFIVLVEALRRDRLAERFGPWRIGIALGLLLATKYTVLLSLPILLLMLGRGWNWRRAGIAIVVALLLAGPWYLRNLLLHANPLYPAEVKIFGVTLFKGMLHLTRSHLLQSAGGVWGVFTQSYYGVTQLLAIVMLVGWLAAWAVETRRAWGDPLKRTCLLGPVIGIGIFVAAAPYGEMRFAYPALLLLFAAGAMALARLPQVAQIGIAAAIVILAALTAFPKGPSVHFTLIALSAAGIGAGIALIRITRAIAAAVVTVFVAVAGALAYVYWSAYVDQANTDSDFSWVQRPAYPELADVWHHVRRDVPPGAKIAYANSYFTYPLMGYGYDHQVVYVPTRRGLERFVDMPPVPERITGEEITAHIESLLRQDPDREQWLRRLKDSRADYLVVMKRGPSQAAHKEPAPELEFATSDPAHFQRVFDSDSGSVFKIAW